MLPAKHPHRPPLGDLAANQQRPPSVSTQSSAATLATSQTSHSFLSSSIAAANPMGSASLRLPNPPTLVEALGMRFLIMDAPSEGNLEAYLREMHRHSVTDLVRVCDPTYPKEAVESAGIRLHELAFPDGEAPSDSLVSSWLALVNRRFSSNFIDEQADSASPQEEHKDQQSTSTRAAAASPFPKIPTIAVHCVAGLGRAPVLVAIALIERGMSALDAVLYLRERRRGAINNRQLKYLEGYRKRGSFAARSSRCLVM